MRRVALYPIVEKEGYFYLNIPKGSYPLGLYEGNGDLEMALIVNDNAALFNKKFLIVEKDQKIEGAPPLKLNYVGLFTRKNRTYFVFEAK